MAGGGTGEGDVSSHPERRRRTPGTSAGAKRPLVHKCSNFQFALLSQPSGGGVGRSEWSSATIRSFLVLRYGFTRVCNVYPDKYLQRSRTSQVARRQNGGVLHLHLGDGNLHELGRLGSFFLTPDNARELAFSTCQRATKQAALLS